MSGSSLRIIVAGLAGLLPVGGVAWDYLQYVLGLGRLGHDVYYWEDTWSWPFDPVKNANTDDPAYSVNALGAFFEAYAPEFADRWCYRHLHGDFYGMPESKISEIASTADIFLNVSGGNIFPDMLSPACLKIFIDTDPGYNQIIMCERPEWSENVDRWVDQVRSHDIFFTYAENIDSPECEVPPVDISWRTTRMPVVLDCWRAVGDAPAAHEWSTVLTWNAFKGPLVYQGKEYWSKNREFEKIIGLPTLTGSRATVALGGFAAPAERLRAAGWLVVDGPKATRTPADYQRLIANSSGEVSPAKHVYAELRTGWFSCRSACYLAAGRPVVVQDTGFRHILPTGWGLLAFSDIDEAVAGIREVESDYVRHSRAAREVAEEYFDSGRVLNALLDDVFSTQAADSEGAG